MPQLVGNHYALPAILEPDIVGCDDPDVYNIVVNNALPGRHETLLQLSMGVYLPDEVEQAVHFPTSM